MIVIRSGANSEVVHDTGPIMSQLPGELRRVLLSELLDHPQPQWRPLPAIPTFSASTGWSILRGTP